MRAVVIIYDGSELPIEAQATIIGSMVNYIDKVTAPAVAQFNDKEVAQLITSGALKGQANVINVEQKEDIPENMAAIYLAKTFKTCLTPTSTSYELASAVMAKMAKTPMKQELSNALFIISQTDAIEKVDNTVCMHHHISKEQLKIIANTYRFMCMQK